MNGNIDGEENRKILVYNLLQFLGWTVLMRY